jgi:hypothetical protein
MENRHLWAGICLAVCLLAMLFGMVLMGVSP